MTIQEAIVLLRNDYVSSGIVGSYKEINNGLCVEFAEQIESLIPGSDHTSNDFYVADVDEGWNGDGNDQWDVESLRRVNTFISAPYTLEMANQIQGYHRWIMYEGKHYDSECPEGVTNFFELPFFKTWLQSIDEQHKKTQRH